MTREPVVYARIRGKRLALIRKRSLLLLGLAVAGRLALGQPRSRPNPADYNGFDVQGALGCCHVLPALRHWHGLRREVRQRRRRP